MNIKKNQDTLTFVIPFKDSSSTLERCIKSLLNQSDPEFRCVMIDDGSTDDWRSIVFDLIDSRFQVISNPCNMGVAHSRNLGNRIANSSFIAVLDSDDTAVTDRVAISKTIISSNSGLDVLITLDAQNNLYFPWIFILGNPIRHSNVTVRKQFIEDNNLFYNPQFKVAHDYDFYCRAVNALGRFCSSQVDFSTRYDSDNSLMSDSRNTMVLETIEVKSGFLSQVLPFLPKTHADAMSRFLTFSNLIAETDLELIQDSIELIKNNPNNIPEELITLVIDKYKTVLQSKF